MTNRREAAIWADVSPGTFHAHTQVAHAWLQAPRKQPAKPKKLQKKLVQEQQAGAAAAAATLAGGPVHPPHPEASAVAPARPAPPPVAIHRLRSIPLALRRATSGGPSGAASMPHPPPLGPNIIRPQASRLRPQGAGGSGSSGSAEGSTGARGCGCASASEATGAQHVPLASWQVQLLALAVGAAAMHLHVRAGGTRTGGVVHARMYCLLF